MMEKITTIFRFERSTKGTHFYIAEDQLNPLIKSTYLQKSRAGMTPAKRIECVVREISDDDGADE